MKNESSIIDLNNESFEQLSRSITSSIVSLKSEQERNLKSIELEKTKLLELKKELRQLQSKIDHVSETISILKYNKRNISKDIRTDKRKSYKLNRSYAAGLEQINLDEYTKVGKRK